MEKAEETTNEKDKGIQELKAYYLSELQPDNIELAEKVKAVFESVGEPLNSINDIYNTVLTITSAMLKILNSIKIEAEDIAKTVTMNYLLQWFETNSATQTTPGMFLKYRYYSREDRINLGKNIPKGGTDSNEVRGLKRQIDKIQDIYRTEEEYRRRKELCIPSQSDSTKNTYIELCLAEKMKNNMDMRKLYSLLFPSKSGESYMKDISNIREGYKAYNEWKTSICKEKEPREYVVNFLCFYKFELSYRLHMTQQYVALAYNLNKQLPDKIPEMWSWYANDILLPQADPEDSKRTSRSVFFLKSNSLIRFALENNSAQENMDNACSIIYLSRVIAWRVQKECCSLFPPNRQQSWTQKDYTDVMEFFTKTCSINNYLAYDPLKELSEKYTVPQKKTEDITDDIYKCIRRIKTYPIDSEKADIYSEVHKKRLSNNKE